MTTLELYTLWHSDMTTLQICQHLGISRSHLHKESVRCGLGRRTHVAKTGIVSCKRIIDPTPEEIKERCEIVRSKWTNAETLRRSGVKRCQPIKNYYYDGKNCSFSY